MLLNNPEIIAAIDRVGGHYRSNIANRFTRRALTTMTLDAGTWSLIESFTERFEEHRYQGYHVDELYTQILAMARFVMQARKQIVPNLRHLAGTGAPDRVSDSDRILKDMAVNNFGSNLKILADSINELYVKVAAIDKELSGTKPTINSRLPELREIGRLLVE
jgi:hypothetical protein